MFIVNGVSGALLHCINFRVATDPAVGSGHFLVSALNRMIEIKYRLGVLFKYNSDKRLKEYKITIENDVLTILDGDGNPFYYNKNDNESREVQETLFNEKRIIIENCLFGVDINPKAVYICQLRLWIELLKNAYYKNGIMETLPNIDINIKTGNSLLQNLKRFEIGKSVITRGEGTGITKTITELKSKVSEYKREKDKQKKHIISARIEQIREGFIGTVQINKGTSTIGEYGSIITPNTSIYENSLEWAFDFPEILDDNGKLIGFDVIIGNPPYIQLQTMHKDADELQKMNYQTYVRKGDIYCLFYEQAFRLIKNDGVLAFITSNKWMRAGYGEALRKFLSEKTNPTHLIDFAGQKVFDSVTVDVNILIYRKTKNNFNTKSCVIKGSNWRNNLSDYVKQNAEINHFDSSSSWTILSPVEQSIKRKIESTGVPLKDWDININYGIKTGCNEAFIINGAKKDELIAADPKSAEIIRPILRGRDIKRYGYNFADLWLISTFPSKKYDIDDYPAVRDYLLSFGIEKLEQTGKEYIIDGNKIKARKKTNNKWFETQDSISYWDDFSKQKIIYPNMTKFLPFYYDNKGFFANQKCFIITGKHIAYLTAFLNSSLFKYCYRDNFPELLGGTRELSKIFFDKISVKPITDSINSEFESKVNQIQTVSDIDDYAQINSSIESLIYSIYELTPNEISTIRNS